MAWKYNPFTDSLDQTGSGGASYINGVVADPTALPVTLGTPALDSVYLAKAGSGVWLINRRPAGLYCRVANNGNANDWVHLGAFPEVNADGNWELYNSTDPTKELKFDLSGLPTATTRTVTAPAGNGQMLVNTQPVQSNNGTLTASAPVLDLEQTWNNAAVAFTGVRFNAVRTAASDSSALLSLTVAGNNRFSVIDTSTGSPRLSFSSSGFAWDIRTRTGSGVGCNFSGIVGVSSRLEFLTTSTSTVGGDVHLVRESADTLAMVRSTNGQTFRLYNTQTDANNYERGFMRWSSNVLQIGAEKAGTGSARALEFQTDGTTRLALSTGGLVQFAGTTSSFPALKRSSTALQVRLADDSAFAPLDAGSISATGSVMATSFVRAASFQCGTANQGISFGDGFTFISGPSTAGVLSITAFNNTDVLVRLGGTSSSWPALNTSGSTLRIRLADNSGFAPLSCGALTLNGNLTASARDIVTDTTTGTRIGTGTTQLLGFWNATPAAQPAAVADATDAASVITQLNALLSRLRTIGVIAT